MKRFIAGIASLLACASAVGQTTLLFQDNADLAANFTTAGTGTNAAITVVSSPTSALTGDAVRIADTSTSFRPSLFYQSPVAALSTGLKISFDMKLTSATSNIVFRMGPTASTLATLPNSVVGVQLTSLGSVVAEQGATVGSGTNANVTYNSAFNAANPFTLTFFYNKSGGTLNFSSQGGPASLAANQWAVYVNGTQKGTGLAERYALDFSNGFGLAWLAGTTANTANVDFQLDNIQYTAIPEPSTYAAMFGAAALGLALLRRRRSVATHDE